MSAYNEAIVSLFRKLCKQVLDTLEGMPSEAMANWRTSQVHGDISTMYGMATHIAGAGEFWTLQAVGGFELNRQRLAEFEAAGSIDTLRARYTTWIGTLSGLLSELSEEELCAVFRRDANPSQGITASEMTKAECILHALEHTALHLGHMQVQRQLWDAEQQLNGA